MKKNLLQLAMLVLCFIFLTACSSEDKKKAENLPDYFGPELENISCYIDEENYVEKSIYVMSRVDFEEGMGDAMCTSVDGTGGEFDYSITYTKEDYKIDDYTLYCFNLEIEDIKFDKDKLNIDSIKIFDEDAKKVLYEFKPQKFEIKKIEGNVNNNYIEYMGTPLSLPRDYLKILYELEAEKKIVIKDIILSNDDIKIANYNKIKNKEITAKDKMYPVEGIIEINENDLSKYTEYVSTVIFKYEVDSEEYISFTPVKEIVYNPLVNYEENFEEYYNEVLLKK